jgi:hypothetical protein
MVRHAAVVLLACAGLVLGGSASAGAATVSIEQTQGPWLTIRDPDGAADNLQVGLLADGTTFTVTGATARAGAHCVRQDQVVRCATEFGAGLDIDLGGGDDQLTLDGRLHDFLTEIHGGEGADTIQADGEIDGGPGDDLLRVNFPSTSIDVLDGGPGNDELQAAGAPATLVGGPGTDFLRGGPANDALIDVGDPGSRDTLLCGGGQNLLERDPGDLFLGCRAARADVLTMLKHRWYVLGHYTQPVLLEADWPTDLGRQGTDYGDTNPTCRGRGCHGARFTRKDVIAPDERIRTRFRLYRGGLFIPGTRRRAVRAGSRIVFNFEISLGGYRFQKRLIFTARRNKLPRVTKICHTVRPGESISRRVSCA